MITASPATASTVTARSVITALAKRPALFSLVEAIEALESVRADAVPLGALGPPAREAVRLRPQLNLVFPSADVVALDPPTGPDLPWTLTTTVLGLYGESSPLPTAYTEQLMSLDEPNAARALLDVINHRLLSFLYRALRKYRVRGDNHTARFAAFLGQDPSASDASSRAAALLACAGCLAQRGGSAAGLEAALNWWFPGMQATVETCVPTWTRIAPDQRSQLAGANVALGRDALLGRSIRNRGLTCRVAVRPRSSSEMAAFLPNGASRAELQTLVAAFNPGQLDIQLDVVVDGAAIAPSRCAPGARLGYDTRLGGEARREHRIRLMLPSPTTHQGTHHG